MSEGAARRDDIRHPEYDAWLIAHSTATLTTAGLLHALASREVRAELHRRWRAGRCNPVVEYTNDIDRELANAAVGVLATRIDAGWKR